MDNTNKPVGESKNKKVFIILGLVLLVAVIVVAVLMSQQRAKEASPEDVSRIPDDAQPYMPDAEPSDDPAEGGDPLDLDQMDEEMEVEIPEILREAVVVVPGANPISRDGTVITPEGNVARNDAVPMSPEAPRQTSPVERESLPASSINLTATPTGWEPNEFTVQAGAPITLAVSNENSLVHVFMFTDPSLAAVAVQVSPGETRVITFNAPAEAGEYNFVCDIPGNAARGFVGKMIAE